MRYTHILFDADNTLFDFNKAERQALTRVLRDSGLEPTARLIARYHEINDLWWSRFERRETTIEELSGARFAQLAEEEGLAIDVKRVQSLYLQYLGECGDMLDGAQELVERLHDRGCAIYIITNGNTAVQHPRIDSSPIHRLLSGLFISMEIGASKPSKEYFDHVLAAIGDQPRERLLVVGDSLRSDILGGINAGLDTCWYAPDGAEPSGGIQPTCIVRHLYEVESVVLGQR